MLDDLPAREAAALSFQATRVPTRVKGTLGVIVSALQAGHLPLEEAVGLVTRLSDRRDIWIHKRICQRVIDALRSAGS